jgi:ABC-2 type transport system ATP-binding protein
MAEYIIEVSDAVKEFKDTTALNHVSVQFEKGKIHGIIGRNGSGKTILFKCICGFMKLTSGKITVKGIPVKPAAPQEIGVIIEEPGFIGSSSGYQNLKFLASIRNKITPDQVKETIKLVGLDPDSKKQVKKYSMGMRQRLGIAQAIMENPDILILDEPMNGLDNDSVQEIRALLLKLKEDGKTILLASHNKEDIAALCDTVHEMDKGAFL